MNAHDLRKFYELLGPFTVFLPIPTKKKSPVFKGWQRITVHDTQAPEYQERLSKHGNLGVLLGKPSADLCSIDIDSDEATTEFLALNPFLAHGLRSRGSRGQNIWVRVRGEYPPLAKLTRHGENWGEWRAAGGQTVIAGIHPSGVPYKLLSADSPVEVTDFRGIQWPAGVQFPAHPAPRPARARRDSSEYSESTESPVSTASLRPLHHTTPLHPLHHNGGTEMLPITPGLKALEATARFEAEEPELAQLYDKLVGQRFPAAQGQRNNAIVRVIPFLYRAVSDHILIRFMEHFYDSNQAIWIDSRDQHLNETLAMFAAVRKTYESQLEEIERAYYHRLPVRHQITFRICRDLGLWHRGKTEPLTFFLSCNHLGLRLGCHTQEAARILNDLVRFEILERMRKGEQRKKGVRGTASLWKWLLPSPPTDQDMPVEGLVPESGIESS